MTHLIARLIASLVTLTTIFPLAIDGDSRGTVAAEDSAITVSAYPKVSVSGGTDESYRKLDVALHKFRVAGLELPDLVVSFSVDEADCRGHKGMFRDSPTPWEISICSDSDAVYEHELAHAWERANLTDSQRAAFMELRGHEFWSGADVPWNERGVEGVAFVIQQGLSDVPLSPALSDEALSRMQAYEFLTETPAPRLTNWMILRDVPCDERPTALSRPLRDKSGLTC
jgi:hypothetical protein